MRAIPLIMQPDMVVATLDDRKTITRRTINLDKDIEPSEDWSFDLSLIDEWEIGSVLGDSSEGFEIRCPGSDKWYADLKPCKYGKPGDILYVRENWQPLGFSEECEEFYVKYTADGKTLTFEPEMELTEKLSNLIDKEVLKKNIPVDDNYRWKGSPLQVRPSIHLPKKLSRIWLQVTDIRAELLQDITEEDAIAEGVELYDWMGTNNLVTPTRWKCYLCDIGQKGHQGGEDLCGAFGETISALHSFRTLWKSINGFYSWNDNPWVWVISFKVLSKTGYEDLPEDIRIQLERKEVTV